MTRLTITYSDQELSEGGEFSATISKETLTATEVIEWLTGVFESFGFGAVSVRINEEYGQSMYSPLDARAREMIQRLKEDGFDDVVQDLLKDLTEDATDN